MSSPEQIILFSYFPLITEKMIETGLKHSQSATVEVIDQITAALGTSQELACAHACFWLLVDDEPVPMLVLSEAQRIYDDLMTWTENKPEAWFTIQFQEKYSAYALALFPDIQKSLKRHELAHLIQEEEFLQDPKYQVIFVPLQFTSEPGNTTYRRLRERITDSLKVYLYDIENIDHKHPEQFDEDLVLKIGTLKVGTTDLAWGYLNGLFKSLTS